ncbi:MAG: hypothetical protein IJ462_04325 [Clostridia bacterium]|nr:hypothetical protein [Clostridia bacterium]
MKKAFIILSAIGIIITAVVFACPNLFDWLLGYVPDDSYTLTRLPAEIMVMCKLLGITTALYGIAGWLLNLKTNRCSIKTVGVSFALSATAGLGALCFLTFIACFMFSHPKRHPIQVPVSMIAGLICAAVFFALLYLYTRLRKKDMSRAGVAFDMIFGILYLPAFYYIFGIPAEIISELV